MMMEKENVKKVFLGFLLACVVALVPAVKASAALKPVPKEALKSLQIAKGKPCNNGVVFMDGKYLAPPYTVKRYGTVIMINDVQVTDQVVPWEEFIKTQDGVQITRTEAPAAAESSDDEDDEEEEEEEEEDEEAEEDDDDPLADLFDDEPKPAKKKAAPKKKKRAKKPAKPAVTTTYALEGDFVMNDASKKLLEKINRYRTDVNARLMKGGFIFFGSTYSRVSGESRETKRILTTMPALLRSSTSAAQLLSELRRNGFSYLTEQIANDLFRNKYCYPQLEARGKKMGTDDKFDSLMRGTLSK